MADYIDIVLAEGADGQGILVEVEDPWGRSINIGEKHMPTDKDPFYRIRVSPADIQIISEEDVIDDINKA